MGCGSSKAVATQASDNPTSRAQELAPTGGGSILLSRQAHPNEDALLTAVDTSFVVSKGGSHIIGRKDAGAWEPGTPIERPSNFTSASVAHLPLGDGRVLQLTYSCVSEQGRSPRPPVKPNQDSFVALAGLGNNPALALFGVFDGHGPRGEDASNYCRINLPDLALRSPHFPKQPFSAVQASFEATHRHFTSSDVSHSPGVDTAVSGTTAITVAFHKDLLMCANVGDSRAMIASEVPGSGGAIVARPLSIDHKPNRPDELARLQQASGRILSERQLGIEGGDPDKYYVCRVHNGTIRYGVLFTRSIGDADGHAHLGLIAAPEVKTGRLSPLDRFVVLATDGVWDYLNEDMVAGLVEEAHGDAHLAVLNVVQTAKAYWDRASVARRDDITAIVIMLTFTSEEEIAAQQAAAAAAAEAALAAAAASAAAAAAAARASSAVAPADGSAGAGANAGSGVGSGSAGDPPGSGSGSASAASSAADGDAPARSAAAAAALAPEPPPFTAAFAAAAAGTTDALPGGVGSADQTGASSGATDVAGVQLELRRASDSSSSSFGSASGGSAGGRSSDASAAATSRSGRPSLTLLGSGSYSGAVARSGSAGGLSSLHDLAAAVSTDGASSAGDVSSGSAAAAAVNGSTAGVAAYSGLVHGHMVAGSHAQAHAHGPSPGLMPPHGLAPGPNGMPMPLPMGSGLGMTGMPDLADGQSMTLLTHGSSMIGMVAAGHGGAAEGGSNGSAAGGAGMPHLPAAAFAAAAVAAPDAAVAASPDDDGGTGASPCGKP